MIARIENIRRSPVVLAPTRDGKGQPAGDEVVVPAGVRVGNKTTPGVYEVKDRKALDDLRARLGKALDGGDLRLVGAV